MAEFEIGHRLQGRIIEVVHQRAIDEDEFGLGIDAERIGRPYDDVGILAFGDGAGRPVNAERFGRVEREPLPGLGLGDVDAGLASVSECLGRFLVQALNALEVDSSVLLVGAEMNQAVARAARNIPRVRTLPVEQLNAVDVLNSKRVVMSVDAVRKAEEIWGGDFVRIKRQPAAVLVDEGGEE